MESEPISEWNEQERELIAKLKEKGREDQETMEDLIAWTEVQEAFANMEDTPRANIVCDIKRAKLYRDAGYVTEAEEIFSSAREQLSYPGHENDQDLLNSF